VTAKVAPYQGHQRLWSVLFKGQQVLSGSFASVAGRYFEPVGTPTPDEVKIAGVIGYGSWDPRAYQLETDTFSQDADGTLHWKSEFKQTFRGEPKQNSPLVGTVYPAKDFAQAKKYKVEVKTETGWDAVEVQEFNE